MYINPYQNLQNGAWYRTNFHTHAGTGPGTCGSNPLDEVIKVYKSAKMDMLCISNHDIFSDTAKYTDPDILMIPGVEYSQNEHMLSIGINKSLHEFDHQSAVDITKSMGGFTIMCHPNWIKKEYWSWENLMKINGYVGIEIINMLIYRLSGSGLATDTWDYLLTQGKMIYGFGNDDFHQYTDAARSFNFIHCDARTFDSMKNSVENGGFCASTGLFPDYLILESNTIKVRVKYPVDTYNNILTYKFITENGKELAVQNGIEALYELKGEKYVRVEVIGENGMMLFYNPVYLKEFFE